MGYIHARSWRLEGEAGHCHKTDYMLGACHLRMRSLVFYFGRHVDASCMQFHGTFSLTVQRVVFLSGNVGYPVLGIQNNMFISSTIIKKYCFTLFIWIMMA